MKAKKHDEISLEKKRGAYAAIGLLFALTIVLAAFEYSMIKQASKLEGNIPIPLEEEVAKISIPEKPNIPPPPPDPIDLSFLIDNGAEEESIKFTSIEIDETQAVFASTNVKFDEETIIEIDPPVIHSDVMPEFNGGLEEMYRFLRSNIKYPKQAIDARTQGRVYLKFIVEKDGSISNINVLSKVGWGCTEEAIRVVKSMPKWKPGEHMGQKVRVIFTLPVSFKLQ